MRSIILTLVPLLLSLGMFAGCSSGDGKVDVSGTVKWNGSPLENGKITFLEPGKSSESADIVNGLFKIRSTPGEKKVGITAFRKVQVNDGRDGESKDHQYLPVKYNEQSTLLTTIESGGNPLEFVLDGDEVPTPQELAQFQQRPKDSGNRSSNNRGSENRRPR